MKTPLQSYVSYFKINEESYPLAVALIDAPMFPEIYYPRLKGKVVYIATTSWKDDELMVPGMETSTAWTSKKEFKRMIKEMRSEAPTKVRKIF